ncbi:peptidoglycan editing factor PgeF [Ghiorsea bivora]|uniref:peptidoglycan editing factor PgeF n=1 Tax=Ghiorsea bivora TaxID=1485545 RepID=UPI00056FEA76|nr:peptidoglycan editing factor PgeF [Ghiorsea bivora]
MFYVSRLLQKHGVQAVFTNREAGTTADFSLLDETKLAHNIQVLCHQTHMPIPHQVIQAHKAEVLHCSGLGHMHQQEADILLATDQGVALAVRTADCVPILLADQQAGVIAAVHAGWKGTVAQAVFKAVQAMCERGANAEKIVTSLGPSIGPCCFEVSPDVAKKFSDVCQQNVSFYRHGTYFVDLASVNQEQLLCAGVQPENIETSSHCTVCHIDPLYYSFRRDEGDTGRQLSMIMLA